MQKVSFTLTKKEVHTALLPNKAKILYITDLWVMWYVRDGDLFEIYTCDINNFDEQVDVERIGLAEEEIKKLAKKIK